MSRAGLAHLPACYWLCDNCNNAQPVGKPCSVCGTPSPCGTPDYAPKRPTNATDAHSAHDVAVGRVGHEAGGTKAKKAHRTRAEAVYLASLESRKASGAVAGWIEQPTLPLPDGARYRPDFLVFFPRGPGLPPRVEVHEVKGAHVRKHLAWSEAGIARYRAARALLPWLRFRMFVVTGKGDIREEKS